MPKAAVAKIVVGTFLTDEKRLYRVETVDEEGMVLAEDARDATTTVLFTAKQVSRLRIIVPAKA